MKLRFRAACAAAILVLFLAGGLSSCELLVGLFRGTVATPSVSPSSGTYENSVVVTLTTPTAGATIRYTTDGSNPLSSTGIVYTTPVVLFRRTTLKAVAVKSGWDDSEPMIAFYDFRYTDLRFEYSSGNPALAVDFTDQPTRTVVVSGAAGRDLFLVKSNVSAYEVPAKDTGRVASGNPFAFAGPDSLPASPVATDPGLPGRPSFRRAGDPGHPEFVADLPEATEYNADPPPVPPDSRGLRTPSSRTVPYGPAAPGLVEGSSTKEFWVQDAARTWVRIRATLRSAGRHCYVWVADTVFSDGSASATDNRLTTAQAHALRDRFDGSPASGYADGIYRSVTTVFGTEFGGGSAGDGGRDEDQHISILVYDVDGDYSASQTGGVLGYFWSKDFYPDSIVGPRSNYSEIFYLDAHFTDRFPLTMYSTLAHELQHMVQFNMKFVKRGVSSPVWFNELCSLVAEDLVAATIGLDPLVAGPVATRFPHLAYHYAESGVTDWLSDPNTLKSYASAFGFGAFLSRNYGGPYLFREIMRNALAGSNSIEAALQTLGYTQGFLSAFRRYGEAFVYAAVPAGSGVATFDRGIESTIEGVRYQVAPADILETRQVKVGEGPVAGAVGPRIYSPDSTVTPLRPFGISVHSGDAWRSVPDSFSLTLVAPTSPDVRFVLMLR